MGYRIGIDVGGTFTDFLMIDDAGDSSVFKTSSTPQDPSIGVLAGMSEMAESLGMGLEQFAREVELIVHGTTVTTNAVLTGNGVRTGLITTEGFRDILEMRRGYREELYNNKLTPPPPLVPRDRRVVVKERTDASGNVVLALDKQSLASAVDALVAAQVQAVAICFMHSHANPVHEQLAKAMVQERLPNTYLTVSSELLPQARFYERLSTAALNSYVGPILKRYLDSLQANLARIGFKGVLLIMQSNGGVATPESTAKTAVMTLLSGPAVYRRARLRSMHHRRYGRHFLRCVGRAAGRAAVAQRRVDCPPAAGAAHARHSHHRRRRWIDRLDRRWRPAPHGSAKRRRSAGAGLLRPRRQVADLHGRQPGPGLSRAGVLPWRTDEARSRSRSAGH
jgi:N-methylhydantoinase A